MKYVVALAAGGEAATGLVLLAYPPIVIRLLFGAEIAGAGVVMSRIAGIGLIAMGLACWPGFAAAKPGLVTENSGYALAKRGGAPAQAICGMLTYSTLATLYLVYLGVGGEWAGKLLWPAVVVHAVLTVLLFRAWSKERGKTTTVMVHQD